MKILLINKFLYPKGGDTVCTLATGEILKSNGHDVYFWGMRHPDNPNYPFQEHFIENIDLNAVHGIKNKLNASAKLLYSTEARAKIVQFLKKTGLPDIVHLHNYSHQISPSIIHIFKKYNIPCVMTLHDYKLICAPYTLLSTGKICERCAGGKYFNCLIQKCVKNSRVKSMLNTIEMYLHHKILHIYDYINTFIAPSNFLKQKYEQMGFKNSIIHVYNFINSSRFIPCYKYSEKSICYVGRLSHEKGVATLIQAFKKLSNKSLMLKIIGTGPVESELKNLASGSNNISFLGYRSGESLFNEITKSMFVVIPSEWYENNPMSVIECFSLGKPVIGARIGGIPELVEDNNTGLTFESGNIDDLKTKIEYLVSTPEKIAAMGKNARNFVEQKLNAGNYYNKIIDIYQNTVNANLNCHGSKN